MPGGFRHSGQLTCWALSITIMMCLRPLLLNCSLLCVHMHSSSVYLTALLTCGLRRCHTLFVATACAACYIFSVSFGVRDMQWHVMVDSDMYLAHAPLEADVARMPKSTSVR